MLLWNHQFLLTAGDDQFRRVHASSCPRFRLSVTTNYLGELLSLIPRVFVAQFGGKNLLGVIMEATVLVGVGILLESAITSVAICRIVCQVLVHCVLLHHRGLGLVSFFIAGGLLLINSLV